MDELGLEGLAGGDDEEGLGDAGAETGEDVDRACLAVGQDAGQVCAGGLEGEEAHGALEEVGEDEDAAAGVEAAEAVGADGGEEDGG